MGFFDMIFEPTLFNAHKLNHYYLLFPSPKKKRKGHPCASLVINTCYNRSKRVLPQSLAILLIYRESETFNKFDDQNKSKIDRHYLENS